MKQANKLIIIIINNIFLKKNAMKSKATKSTVPVKSKGVKT